MTEPSCAGQGPDRAFLPGDCDGADELDLASLIERGYVRARFGDVPVLITPEFAARIEACRKSQP